MKKVEEKRQSDYLLLYCILSKYMEKAFKDSTLAPRYLKVETIDEILVPFGEMKYLIQRVEWLRGTEHVEELLRFMGDNGISLEELRWAVDMFAVQKQDVLNRIEEGV